MSGIRRGCLQLGHDIRLPLDRTRGILLSAGPPYPLGSILGGSGSSSWLGSVVGLGFCFGNFTFANGRVSSLCAAPSRYLTYCDESGLGRKSQDV